MKLLDAFCRFFRVKYRITNCPEYNACPFRTWVKYPFTPWIKLWIHPDIATARREIEDHKESRTKKRVHYIAIESVD